MGPKETASPHRSLQRPVVASHLAEMYDAPRQVGDRHMPLLGQGVRSIQGLLSDAAMIVCRAILCAILQDTQDTDQRLAFSGRIKLLL